MQERVRFVFNHNSEDDAKRLVVLVSGLRARAADASISLDLSSPHVRYVLETVVGGEEVLRKLGADLSEGTVANGPQLQEGVKIVEHEWETRLANNAIGNRWQRAQLDDENVSFENAFMGGWEGNSWRPVAQKRRLCTISLLLSLHLAITILVFSMPFLMRPEKIVTPVFQCLDDLEDEHTLNIFYRHDVAGKFHLDSNGMVEAIPKSCERVALLYAALAFPNIQSHSGQTLAEQRKAERREPNRTVSSSNNDTQNDSNAIEHEEQMMLQFNEVRRAFGVTWIQESVRKGSRNALEKPPRLPQFLLRVKPFTKGQGSQEDVDACFTFYKDGFVRYAIIPGALGWDYPPSIALPLANFGIPPPGHQIALHSSEILRFQTKGWRTLLKSAVEHRLAIVGCVVFGVWIMVALFTFIFFFSCASSCCFCCISAKTLLSIQLSYLSLDLLSYFYPCLLILSLLLWRRKYASLAIAVAYSLYMYFLIEEYLGWLGILVDAGTMMLLCISKRTLGFTADEKLEEILDV